MSARRFSPPQLGLILLTCFAVLVVAPLSFAQAPAPAGPDWKDPETILSWWNANTFLIGVVISVIWKHAPIVKDFSNKALGWIHLANQVFFQLAGVATAAAAGEAVTGVHHSLFVRLAIAVANASVSKYAWDYVLKPTLGDWLDWKLGRTPQTPHFVVPTATISVSNVSPQGFKNS